MRAIICLDDNYGYLFNHRRQSMDIKQRKNLLKLIGSEKLYLTSYSFDIYKDMDFNMEIVDYKNLLEIDVDGNYLFEKEVSKEIVEKTDTIICYFWNRKYPADKVFDEIKDNKKWREVSRYEFEGYSHEEITRVIYERIWYE